MSLYEKVINVFYICSSNYNVLGNTFILGGKKINWFLL